MTRRDCTPTPAGCGSNVALTGGVGPGYFLPALRAEEPCHRSWLCTIGALPGVRRPLHPEFRSARSKQRSVARVCDRCHAPLPTQNDQEARADPAGGSPSASQGRLSSIEEDHRISSSATRQIVIIRSAMLRHASINPSSASSPETTSSVIRPTAPRISAASSRMYCWIRGSPKVSATEIAESCTFAVDSSSSFMARR